MRKRLSPPFVVIVIVIAIALGVLYAMTRYRAYEARWAAEARALQQQRDRALRAGRPRMWRRSRGTRMRSRGSGQPGRAQPPSDIESQPGTP